MNRLIFTLLTITILVCGWHKQALAAERVSVSEWSQAWVKASQKAGSFKTQDLEKKALGACSDCANKERLSKARSVFAKGQFDEALRLYNEIPRGNTYWLTSTEEKGWSYFRKEDYQKSLAQTKTLLSPQFAEVVNAEAYLLQSLSQLRMCDYKGVFETHQTFKDKQKKRIMEVQNLAEKGWNEDLAAVLRKVDYFPLELADIGDSAQRLPLLIYKDLEFQKQLLRFKASFEVLQRLPESALKKEVRDFNSASFITLKKRVQTLAQKETDANFKVIQKLNLVEVEAIQRVHADTQLSENSYQKGEFKDVGDDKLVFMDDGRPWIDELDKFEVSAKSCVKGIRRKM
ncbi:MAG: hypothetical protein AAGB31_14025 [Bdellovibrio sp.]